MVSVLFKRQLVADTMWKRNLIFGIFIIGQLIGLTFSDLSLFAAERYLEPSAIQTTIDEVVKTNGEPFRERASVGVAQAAALWMIEDGTPEEFRQFCVESFMADSALRRQTFDRIEWLFGSISAQYGDAGRDLSWHLDVATGPLLPIDQVLARYSPWTHFSEDMFQTRVAFIIILNFPRYTLAEKQALGPGWSRQQWAEAGLAEWFSSRVPPAVSQEVRDASQAADMYISDYNIYMHHLIAPDNSRPFPKGMRLVTHWNLRDEIKALYGDKDKKAALAKQEMIYDVMLKIVRQTIPAVVINNPGVDWQVSADKVIASPIIDGELPSWWVSMENTSDAYQPKPESDTRYERWLGMFRANLLLDPYYPQAPSLIQRRFQEGREMSEGEVERILTSVTASPLMAELARLIEKRLGRPLRPIDIWYNGFKPVVASTGNIDSLLSRLYPSAEVFQADLPRILKKLDFDDSLAAIIVSKVEVDPSRGIGHAAAPGGIGSKARLRTRVNAEGMDYKGYNIAIHEFGHNVEQVISLYDADHFFLRGVPFTAMTEAFAFTFQDRDMDLHPDLARFASSSDNSSKEEYKILDNLWGTYEISGVSLVDMRVWRWMYAHPQATPAELKEAVIQIAKEVWNQYFAPVIGVRDVEILAIYSHMIDGALYLPDYPLGSIIQFQIEQHLKKSPNLGKEIQRICSIGSITPELWMQTAVGESISAEPLLSAATEALKRLNKE